MTTQTPTHATIPVELLEQLEAALGENLQWLGDQFDQHVRQGDPDTLRRLRQMTDAWAALCRVLVPLRKAQE